MESNFSVATKTLTFISLLLLLSCQNNVIYESEILYENGWHKDSCAVFNIFIDDTTQITDFILTFKHTDNYPYQNLWLFVTVDELENKTHIKDTLELYMANINGQWFGKKKGKNYFVSTYYKYAVKTAYKGNYRFEFQQGMRLDNIEEIKSVKFKMVISE